MPPADKSIPTDIHLFKFNNRNTKKRCEICSKAALKARDRRL